MLIKLYDIFKTNFAYLAGLGFLENPPTTAPPSILLTTACPDIVIFREGTFSWLN